MSPVRKLITIYNIYALKPIYEIIFRFQSGLGQYVVLTLWGIREGCYVSLSQHMNPLIKEAVKYVLWSPAVSTFKLPLIKRYLQHNI